MTKSQYSYELIDAIRRISPAMDVTVDEDEANHRLIITIPVASVYTIIDFISEHTPGANPPTLFDQEA